MENPKTTHWGAALIVGLCAIAAAIIGSVVTQSNRAERQPNQVATGTEDSLTTLKGEVDSRDAQISDLSGKLASQDKLIADLRRELDSLKVSQQQPISTTAGVTPPQQSNDGNKPEPPPPAPKVAVVNQFPFRVTLQKCFHLRGEDRVDCELLIENTSDQEQPLLFNPQYYMGGRVSFLSDRTGHQYRARIENDAVSNALNSPPRFVPHVPTLASLHFDNVPETISQVTCVVVADQGLFGHQLTFTLSNIDIVVE